MSRSRILPIALLAALAACAPRQPVAPPPPPAPPPPAMTAEELARAGDAEARRAWDEGTRLGRQGRWPEAEARYRQAARVRPDSATYHMALATALLQQGRESEAADALQAAIRAEEARPSPNHRVLAVDYERLIALFERTGRLDEARTARERQRFHRTMRDSAPPR